LNWAENYQSVIELYQTADHPALSPKSGGSPWMVAVAQLFLADSAPPRGKPARKTPRLTENNGGAPSSCGRFGDFLLFFMQLRVDDFYIRLR
jgi:hypothetical protein